MAGEFGADGVGMYDESRRHPLLSAEGLIQYWYIEDHHHSTLCLWLIALIITVLYGLGIPMVYALFREIRRLAAPVLQLAG